MKVFTSCFANLRNIERMGIVPVSISLFPPKDFNGPKTKTVAPTWEMLNRYKKDFNKEKYIEDFQRILDAVDAKAFAWELHRLGGGKDVAMCCFEMPGEFCHRRLVANWLTAKFGIEVKEL